MGKHLMKIIETFYNNELENIGNHDSFVWYGPRWAQAATAPHRMYKMYSTGELCPSLPFLRRADIRCRRRYPCAFLTAVSSLDSSLSKWFDPTSVHHRGRSRADDFGASGHTASCTSRPSSRRMARSFCSWYAREVMGTLAPGW